MKDVKKILVVCTGNSCRSIMAEGYLVNRLKENGFKNISVISAGTHTQDGFRPTPEAIQVMKENGIDVSGYTSTPVNKSHVEKSDIILIMEKYHKEKILDLFPDSQQKIYYLRDFSKEVTKRTKGIEDPVGKPIEKYREIFEIIKNSIEGFMEWLKK